jgi:imidazolonepropionase-like amidohydrolase
MADEIGTVEQGKLADLVVFDRDPLADPEVLADAARVRMVVKGGGIVKGNDQATTV